MVKVCKILYYNIIEKINWEYSIGNGKSKTKQQQNKKQPKTNNNSKKKIKILLVSATYQSLKNNWHFLLSFFPLPLSLYKFKTYTVKNTNI